MKLEIEIDKEIYDYARKRNINLTTIINSYLRRKFKLGTDNKRPQRNYPIEKSIEYGIKQYRVNINDYESVISLVNEIVNLYPNVSEGDVFILVDKELKKLNKYNEFDVSQRYRMNK